MINLMPSRLISLQESLAGYQQTHTDLIALRGHSLIPAGLGNDLGPFYFIPHLVNAFHLSLENSITLFLGAQIVIGLIAGLIGLTLLWRRNRYFWWSVLSFIALAGLIYKIGDIYLTSAAVVMGTAPYILLSLRRQKLTPWLGLGFLLLGLIYGLANSFRSQAGTTGLLFAVLALLFASAFSRLNQIKLIVLLLIGVLVPGLFFNHLITLRDGYLKAHTANYTPTITSHPFWHTAYIGFGYLNNDLGIKYLDEVGIAKVAAVDPKVPFLSPAYEQILRDQTFALIRTNPLFALMTLFAKLGVIFLLYLPLFANFGLWKAFSKRIGGWAYLPFYLTLLFAALPGLIAIPDLRYLTGFAALAVFYGLAVINERSHA